MRIASLVPAGSEIAYALGAGDELVAVTHDCDYPPAARSLPRITSSTIAPGSDSFAIDLQVRAAVERGETTFHLDAAALAAARPDVLLGQTLCEVCAVTVAQLPTAMDPAPEVVPLDGQSLEGIFSDIERVGRAIGRKDAALALVADLRDRIARVRTQVAGAERPTAVCLEWLAPLFNAGHWVPEQVTIAGGEDLLGKPLVPSVDVRGRSCSRPTQGSCSCSRAASTPSAPCARLVSSPIGPTGPRSAPSATATRTCSTGTRTSAGPGRVSSTASSCSRRCFTPIA